ncbi:MAG TPA: PAS domain S-box protein [Phycisphaerae bacterium]|nr:PAS domain S-box protein [Phycisphaerae bacterium]HRW54973.1 PAS domain S-box protein [Phycisphaerae bacterium]
MSSECEHRAIIEHAADGIITIDAEGLIESVNPAVVRLFGYAESELLGSNVAMLVPDKDRHRHDSALKRYVDTNNAGGPGLGREVDGRHRNGSLIPIYLSISHFELDGRRHLTGIIRDLSDRHKYEASLRRISAIFESSNDAIISTTLGGAVTDWNDAAQELYGYTAEEIIGHNIAVIIPPGREQEGAQIFRRIRNGERIVQLETQRRRKCGRLVTVSINISPIRDRSGAVVGASASARDISARKRVEHQLQERADRIQAMNDELERQRRALEDTNTKLNIARCQAEAAARAKSEFLANMSHEIRTPMTAILGFIGILSEMDDLSQPETREMLDTIRQNSHHLLRIIDDILDISKIDSGKLHIDATRFNPVETILDVMTLMRGRANPKGLYLEFDAVGDLPLTITSDPMRLRQILTNLIGNAIKFTETGGVRVTAQLLQEGDSPMLEVCVADTGIGLPDDPGRLFRAFEQADAGTTRQYGGTGLGLSISARLARLLGGRIRATHAPDQGAEFRVTIAAGDLRDVPIVSPQTYDQKPEHRARRAAHTLPSCRILVVDDGVDNCRLLTHILTLAGADVEVVHNGAEAVERLASDPRRRPTPDIVLMDMQMPVMDGYAATRTLRENGCHLPIIALTANAMRDDRVRCLDAGCDDYQSKPIDRLALLDTIRRRLASLRTSTTADTATGRNSTVPAPFSASAAPASGER